MGKVGIGYCNGQEALQSGQEAIRKALAKGNIIDPSLVIAFATKNTDPAVFVQGIQTVIGPGVPIIGGAAMGLITIDQISYTGSPVGVAVFDRAFLSAKVACVSDIHLGLEQAGANLGSCLIGETNHKATLIFFDSLERYATAECPPAIHSSRPIMHGVYSKLSSQIPIYGAGMAGDYGFSSSFIFGGSEIGRQKLVGTALMGSFTPFASISHGCTHLDGVYRRITKQQGPMIMELDGEPIVKVIDDVYGSQAWRKEIPVRTLTIGINTGPRFAPFNEDAYVNRLIAGLLPNDAGIVLFEEGPQEGDEIQFLQRDSIRMIESARVQSSALLDQIRNAGKHPAFALYIDCGGRAASFCLSQTEEASTIQELLRKDNIPLLGLYSGIELAPIQGMSRGLDWTGVLVILAD